MTSKTNRTNSKLSQIGLFAGPVAGLIVALVLPSAFVDAEGAVRELNFAARGVAGVATMMAIWWLSEAISIYATALLPLCLFPLLGVSTIKVTASSYGHEIIFLFMGGFILALALERWGLHKRLALNVLSAVGPKPAAIIGAFMGVAAFLSMWVTNTATTLMLLPVAVSVIGVLPTERSGGEHFSLCLLLGIAYAASLGGMGTIVGTAPNVFAVSFIELQLGRQISFVEWMSFGLPLVVIFVPLVWLTLTRFVYPVNNAEMPGVKKLLADEQAAMPGFSRGEVLCLTIFCLTALAWLTRPLLNSVELGGVQVFAGLTDAGVAVISAMLLFIIPVNLRRREFLMNWSTAVRLPWGMLILFGGGLALAAAIVGTGFNLYLGSWSATLINLPEWLMLLIVVAIVVFMTELVSNTATTATLLPVMLAVAMGLELPPLLLLLPATFAASCAFMLPVATPPNAIVFGSGMLRIGQMSRAGVVLNIVAIVILTAASYAILMPVLDMWT